MIEKRRPKKQTHTSQENTLAEPRMIKLTEESILSQDPFLPKKLLAKSVAGCSNEFNSTLRNWYDSGQLIWLDTFELHNNLKNSTEYLTKKPLQTLFIETEFICRPKKNMKILSKQIQSLMSLIYGSGIFPQHLSKTSVKQIQMALDVAPLFSDEFQKTDFLST